MNAETNEKQVKVSRVVQASPDRVFGLLSDPKQHRAIDGSGTLRGTTSGPITGVGQVFWMELYRDDLGPWASFSTVVEYERGTAIGWAPVLDQDSPLAPKLAGITTGGHTYTYRLRETGDGTEVQLTYNWSTVTDPKFEALVCPFVTRDQLLDTLDRLADTVSSTQHIDRVVGHS